MNIERSVHSQSEGYECFLGLPRRNVGRIAPNELLRSRVCGENAELLL